MNTIKKDLNKLVKMISEIEGGKVDLDAPQIREVLKCIAVLSAAEDDNHFVLQVLCDYQMEPHIQRAAKKYLKGKK